MTTTAPEDRPDPPAETVAAAEELTAEVVASFGQAPPRLRTLMQDLISHLHTFVVENDVTEDEWLQRRKLHALIVEARA